MTLETKVPLLSSMGGTRMFWDVGTLRYMIIVELSGNAKRGSADG